MVLYLSSDGLGSDPSSIRATSSNAIAAVIANAMDDAPVELRVRALADQSEQLRRLGYDVVEIDLRDVASEPVALGQRLARAHLLWVMGGNTFTLARACERAELRSALLPALADAGLIYAGSSAGSVLAGPGLEGIDLVDDPGDPSRVPPALRLTTERVIPHWRSGHPESAAIERVAAWLDRAGLPHRRLRDGQALLVDDGEARIVGVPAG